ncbi:glycoside hydrolase family 73 protein [Lacticaseibacillus rhamnosus]|uniref:glycoside hydrolase family 73 protein n=1 Tax=Lacticaseibacillus rhamnosus TaxID=47715 RepID=UPI0007DF91ED|nr:glycoside hydrolase family 73 protein [Lacticaseibacillus rhamnosus]MBB1163955.1 N-acetylmuramidase [Lacticaseibacillus rhamnosus]MCT3192035.1 N-acetylmuramidase [Lacticaseibacillus rhamnosus]MCT3372893.1 N-acetylmuramidase [Lacticaseibacillus rhamnosus]MCZ2732409.1 glycoside hydrolase family 73 protein [Lacticaseibacillus rhamnosus]MCZ2735005.1 glycoside hydrolase family 73 protein [Lacticaseibacillus rhamnosus]
MAKKRRRFTLKKIPLAAWLVIAFFAVGSMLVVSSYWSQRQAEVSQRQAIVDKKAAEKAKKKAFIKRLVPTAQTMQKQYGVLTSITLAQAILESDWGTSTLAKDYHNLFGIKGTDPATTKVLRTKEYVNDKWITVDGRFRVYSDDAASIRDHALLFVNGTDWNPQQYATVRAAKDYKTAASALQTDGYATDPDYPQKLIHLIEAWNLTQYDN